MVDVVYNISKKFMVGRVVMDEAVPEDKAEQKTWRRRFMREAAHKIAEAMLAEGCLSLREQYDVAGQQTRYFVVATAGKRDSIRLPK